MSKEKVIGYLFTEGQGIESTPKIKSVNKDWIVFESILQEADEINRNRRRYSKSVLTDSMNSPRFTELVKKRQLVGEAGHPVSDDAKRQMAIDQTRISHIMLNPHWRGNMVYSDIMTANTSVGRDFKGLIEQGFTAAFSMRAMGNVVRESNGIVEVGSPLHVLTWDNVIYPSHKNAYMTSLKEDTSIITDLSEVTPQMIPLEESFVRYAILQQNVQECANILETTATTQNVRLTEDKKALMICRGGSCMKLMLEDHVRQELNSALGIFK